MLARKKSAVQFTSIGSIPSKTETIENATTEGHIVWMPPAAAAVAAVAYVYFYAILGLGYWAEALGVPVQYLCVDRSECLLQVKTLELHEYVSAISLVIVKGLLSTVTVLVVLETFTNIKPIHQMISFTIQVTTILVKLPLVLCMYLVRWILHHCLLLCIGIVIYISQYLFEPAPNSPPFCGFDSVIPEESDPGDSGVPESQDSKYFYEDGNLFFVVRPDNVLFKIHHSRLPVDIFFATFKPPLVPDIIPVYDNVNDFRALCWAFYASQEAILDQWPGTQDARRPVDILRLVAIVRMATKYTSSSLQSWGLRCIRAHATLPSNNYFDTCPTSSLLATCNAVLDTPDNEWHSLSTTIENKWIARLTAGGLQGQLRAALDFGEARGRNRFLAEAYYQHAVRMALLAPIKARSPVLAASEVSESLTAAQDARLSKGFRELILYRDSIPPKLSNFHDPHCRRSYTVALPVFTTYDVRAALSLAMNVTAQDGCLCRRNKLSTMREAFDPVDFFLV
ncbi:F-box domain-containing protein [Mycena indigotica]|uniref:F-box domain-containing protein n=1 Tax=Mycena indigotica TaxID=2126181 RepID=A0A8H6SFN9_9AGAR|nr:F-box domain-containing protein [Mycena indigotica]KAF7298656.1 F-box domain-containing protein [Mycena indigotica]